MTSLKFFCIFKGNSFIDGNRKLTAIQNIIYPKVTTKPLQFLGKLHLHQVVSKNYVLISSFESKRMKKN